MDAIHKYIFSVVAAALICSVAKSLTGNKTGQASVVSLIAGSILTVTMLSPLLNMDKMDFQFDFENFHESAIDTASIGTSAAYDEFRTIIKEQVETYIQDKATSLGANVIVNVVLTDNPPTPVSAEISGNISPYVKSVLSNYITDTFDITEENQKWQ